jgi:hypothetical protein
MNLPAKVVARLAAVIATLACSACAVFPMHVYVADARDGELLHSSCALNTHVPDGIRVETAGVDALVSLHQFGRLKFVEVRLDIPPDRIVVLKSDTIRIDRRTAGGVIDARFPNISRVDSPAINSYAGAPAIQQYLLPVDAPLVGGAIRIGRVVSKKHYWLAARVDVGSVDTVWVTLPGMRIDGIDTRFPELRFERRLIVATAVFNC